MAFHKAPKTSGKSGILVSSDGVFDSINNAHVHIGQGSVNVTSEPIFDVIPLRRVAVKNLRQGLQRGNQQRIGKPKVVANTMMARNERFD